MFLQKYNGFFGLFFFGSSFLSIFLSSLKQFFLKHTFLPLYKNYLRPTYFKFWHLSLQSMLIFHDTISIFCPWRNWDMLAESYRHKLASSFRIRLGRRWGIWSSLRRGSLASLGRGSSVGGPFVAVGKLSFLGWLGFVSFGEISGGSGSRGRMCLWKARR
jgi:hypothetical protein